MKEEHWWFLAQKMAWWLALAFGIVTILILFPYYVVFVTGGVILAGVIKIGITIQEWYQSRATQTEAEDAPLFLEEEQFRSAFLETLKLPRNHNSIVFSNAYYILYKEAATTAPHAAEEIYTASIVSANRFLHLVPLVDQRPLGSPPPRFTTSVIDRVDAAKIVSAICEPFFETEHFTLIKKQLDVNVHVASRASLSPLARDKKLIYPKDSPLEGMELIKAYLFGTVLYPLFDLRVSLPLTELKKNHWMITARTGHGKSQLLQTLILEHLQEPNPPPMIVIDSQGQMLEKIENLALFSTTLKDRLVVVDPPASPALNMFNIPEMSESSEIEVLALYNYIFSAIDADLTSRQGTAFSYVIRLMLATSGATILTLLELMEEQVKDPAQSKFWPIIKTLDPVAQSYFQNRFFTPATKQTKEQLSTRLYGVLRVRAFSAMFGAVENKLDLYQAIQDRKVVLINTNNLGDASSIFGRYMIAQCLQAAFRRDITTEPHPTLLFVDEAFDLMDSQINRILIQARKFGLFIRFATQQFDQIPNEVRAAAAANTEVKLAGGLSADDARRLAGDFRTTAEYLLSIRKYDEFTEWACMIQNVLDKPVTTTMKFGLLERAPSTPPPLASTLALQRRNALKATPIATVPVALSPTAAGVAPEKKLPSSW